MSSKHLACTAFAFVLFYSSPSVPDAIAQRGSYAQSGAYEFSPFQSDYVKSPPNPEFLNDFEPFGNYERTQSFANSAIVDLDLADVKAWGMGDAYGEISAAGLIKSVEANQGYKKNGNYFAFARSSVRGTTFQVQGSTCNDFDGNGSCDIRILIKVPSTLEAPPLRATTLDAAPDASILLPAPQQLLADNPVGLLTVEGCEFAMDPGACLDPINVEQALDLSLRVSGDVAIAGAAVDSFAGAALLSPTSGLSVDGIFAPTGNASGLNVFGDLVTDPLSGRTTATVSVPVTIREYIFPVDNTTFLSPLITIDLEMTLNGVPLPGIPAGELDPDQPIEDFYDPQADPLEIPHYFVFGFTAGGTAPAPARGAAGDFNLLLSVDGGMIVADPPDCDFNQDMLCDTVDIDQMFMTGDLTAGVRVVSGLEEFDMNSDGFINIQDRNLWLASAATANGLTAPYVLGDTDLDNDVDTVNTTKSIGNFTGAGGSGKVWSLGDIDGDGDNDTFDVTTVIGNYTGADGGATAALRGALSRQQNPDLIYDMTTGEVRIDADGSTILSFSILNHGAFVTLADFSDLDADVLAGIESPLIDNEPEQIGWVSALATGGVGFDGPELAVLGNILADSLSPLALGNLFASHLWAGPDGSGGSFDIVIIPEPGGLVLALLGTMVAVVGRCRFCRALKGAR